MVHFKYRKTPLSTFPQEIVQQYNLKDIFSAYSYVYMEIRKGIPGLKQAGRLARDRLPKNLTRNGYVPVKHTPSLWHNHMNELLFSLVVNYFGIKCTCKEDADHILKFLQEDYKITEDWTGDKYLGLTLKWD